ncbi:hypothetical protein A5662_20400 [Mycobacteriaceae bacterium 1482268.1]|nr:hypothetical protein A5662_20400 [Mycobacteriaceae bacterium 1482268.1]
MFGGVFVVLVAWALWSWEDSYRTKPVDEVAYLVCLAFAAGCVGRAASSARGRRRLGWRVLLASLTVWIAALVVRMFEEVRLDSQPWRFTLTDLVLLFFPVGAYVSLRLLSDLGSASRRRLLLDGIIVATSLFVISWVAVLNPLRGEGAAPIATVAHVVADVVLMTTAILVWSRTWRRHSTGLLSAGITTIVIGDIGSVYTTGVGGYHDGGLVDLVRVAGCGMVAFAALLSVDEQPIEEPLLDLQPGVRIWLPYLPLLLAGVVAIGYEFAYHDHHVLLIGEAVLVVAVLARQFLVLWENRRLLAEVAREAFHDNLTGLANRANFLDALERAMSRRRRGGDPVAVLCLDLDNFKGVNDALGHPAGDELLIRVAERLRSTLGSSWIVARLGGDEFAALCEGHIEVLAAANSVLDAFATPIVIDGIPQRVRPSVGLTTAAASSQQTSDDLLLNADLAMYAAKRDGGGCVRSFVPDLPVPWELQQTPDPAAAQRGSAQMTPRATPGPKLRDKSDNVSDVRLGGRWPPAGVCAAIGLLALGVAVFTASIIFRAQAGRVVVFDSFLYPALSIGAAVIVFWRVLSARAERVPCLLIGVGMASAGIGDAVYAAQESTDQMLSAADPFYLAFYPFLYAGLLVLMRQRLKRVPTSLRLDALICALTLGAVAVAVATGPVEAALRGQPATVLVGLAYPVGDLLLLALTAGMLPILGWRAEIRWSLLVVSFMIYAIADTVYLFQTSAGTYVEGTWIDACWPIASLLIVVVAWLPPSGVPPRPKPALTSYIPVVLCAGVALIVAVLANQSRVAVGLAALTLIAVAWRFAVTFRDVSATAEAHRQAMTDELTRLPNRMSLATTLTAVTPQQPSALFRSRASRALILLDIDQFREINDFAGRKVGDQLLKRIAARLRRNVRPGDIIARTGSDEFAILFAGGADVTTARARAGAILEALRVPFELDPITLQIDASISIALCPDHCEHPHDLLNCVETTMPHAKAAPNKIVVYDVSRTKDNGDHFVDDLRNALTSDEMTCFYQPKIRAEDGRVHSVEALLRWRHPRRGLLMPEEFLPAAEGAGLMRQVANCVVNIALGQVRAWRDDGIRMTVAVNLSMVNLLDLDLVDTIDRLLTTHQIPPEALILEITESTFAKDSSRSRKTAVALRRLGVRISLDDYGTGWSSLARLQDLSVDELKLDRIFVSRLGQDPRSIAIVRSTVALAHSLGADLVAEGVEDESTLEALRRYGCNITQGFVHTPPLPAGELLPWIARCTPQLVVGDLALHPDLR